MEDAAGNLHSSTLTFSAVFLSSLRRFRCGFEEPLTSKKELGGLMKTHNNEGIRGPLLVDDSGKLSRVDEASM